jgi:ABC-type multidrug transport system permease subunit
MGEVAAGMARGLLACVVILLLGCIFGVFVSVNLLTLGAILLNSFIFASLAVASAMRVKSHGDQTLLTNFIITPMAFLGGTFFPLDQLPRWGQMILGILPLTHATHAVRAASFHEPVHVIDYAVLFCFGVGCFVFAFLSVNKAKT